MAWFCEGVQVASFPGFAGTAVTFAGGSIESII